jgi:hypothetical protein
MWLQSVFPLAIGTDIDCGWRDNQFYPARVIERRQLPNPKEYEYYMHYLICAPCGPLSMSGVSHGYA